VDALIYSLDRLISKKRAIKTASMQQLLTGKQRLPEFGYSEHSKKTAIGELPDYWDCHSVQDLAIRAEGAIKIGPFGSQLKKEYLTNSGYKVYGQENVFEKDMSIGNRFIDRERFRELQSCEIRPRDFLISMMGTVGKCMIVPERTQKGIMDSHLLRLRLDEEKIHPKLLIHLFASRIVLDQVKRLSVGGIMEGLSSSILRNVVLPLPSVDEQTAIATVLSDMDAEISALEARREKTRQVKQGMMQELLTGRTRLVGGAKRC
jgi:type I restriction enzyme S subunit